MGAASALGRYASILSPLSQAFGADDKQERASLIDSCRFSRTAAVRVRRVRLLPRMGAAVGRAVAIAIPARRLRKRGPWWASAGVPVVAP